jgi:endo-1,3(4)-beta-glucanase
LCLDVWKGVVSGAAYGGNLGADFGNTAYNDHHFHWGYFVFTASVIAYLDKSWLTPANRDWVDMLVRDYANPSPDDPYFPQSRAFDWFDGHSWAHGLFESWDGKDQESSSEDVMAAYAIKQWGYATGDAAMEAR